jgi:hypothetical protein
MIETEHLELVLQIRKLLQDKLNLSIQDHGLWRIQCLIHDESNDNNK